MNQQSKMLTPPINETLRSLRKITPLALAALVVTIALLITYIPNVPAMAQAKNGAIPSLALASSEPGQLVITWETPDPAPTDYRVRWAPTSENFLSYRDDNEAQRGNLYPLGDVTTLTLSNLTPGESYKVQIRSRYYNADRSVRKSSGPWTQVMTQRVMDHPPAAPNGLAASQVSHDSLTLTWNDPQDARITGHQVLRGTDADSLSIIQADTGSPSTNYTDSTVEPETSYHYAVFAMSQDGDGNQSATFSVTTPVEPVDEETVVLIDPPAGLAESDVKHDSLTLIWDDPNNDAITGYRILKGTQPDDLSVSTGNTGTDDTKYTDPNVEDATTYFYSVNALTTNGIGPRSHVAVTTPAENIQSVPGETDRPNHQTLVSSMGRTSHQMANLISRDVAQEFQTGPNPSGYKIASIDLYLTSRSSDLTVELRTGSTTGTVHATLSPSGELSGHGVYTFIPPANTTVAANTHYWIVVKGSRNGWFKAALGETVAAVPGWELAENYEYRPKYSYNEQGIQSVNTATETFKAPGHMSIRINRLNNVATGNPSISGTPKTQQILTASAASIQDGDGLPATFNYQWMRYSADGAEFEAKVGTDSIEYLLVLEDEGNRIRVMTSFVDGKDNDEGPFLSDAYPSGNTITAPLIYTIVSNIGRTPDSNRPANISAMPTSQSFTASSETAGHILTSITVVSIDAEGDEFAIKICTVQGDVPTASCTDLDPPASFTAGPLEFTAPSDRTITLSKGDTYALVFSAAAGTTATIPATDEDNEDPISLPGWSIRNRSQFFSNNQWMDRGYDVAYLIAIKGQPTQISQASGRPTIAGSPAVGQVVTASTESITVPEGVAGNFSYQWKRLSSDGADFEANVGTNSNQYRLTADELDKKIQVEVSFVDTRGRVVGFPLTSPAYPTGRTIGAPSLMSNTSQTGNSIEPMSTEVGQSFTTGTSPHGHQLSSVTIFYEDGENRRINLKVCETTSGGRPTAECWNLNRPGSFIAGPLNFTVPEAHFRVLDPNTTYAAVLNGPRPRTVETTVETACPQTDPDFTESCVQEVVITVIVAAQIGVTTSDGEDTLSSPGWSVGNAYQENREGAWRDVSSGKSVRIALQAEPAPNKEPTGIPVVTGTARVGKTLTATQGDVADQNGLPGTLTYRWKRYAADGTTFETDIGDNSSRYTLTSRDVGRKIKVEASYTDLHGYGEGPLISDNFPHGAVVITTAEDDLLVSNIGNPETETVQTTRKIAQVFATGTNPNGYQLTSVTISGNSAPVKICRFTSVHYPSPSSNCADNPSPENPSYLRREWLYAVVIDPNTVDVTNVDEEDPTSRHDWAIRGNYQEQNQQGDWHNTALAHAVRMELQGRPASPFNRLGQLTATPADRQVTLNWMSWLPGSDDVIQKFQYRVKQIGGSWNPDWTDIPGSNASTEAHTLRNLINGVEQTIELRAVFDQDGQTVYSGSASISATPRGPLTAPRNLDASTEGDGGVRLNWSDPADSTLTGYQYRYHPGDRVWNPDWTNVQGSNAATTSHTLTGMAKNLRHTLEVRTLRDDAQGPAASSSVTPRGPMPRLQNLMAAADDQEATLSWDNPGEHGITGYQYRRRATAERAWNPDWTSIPGSNANTASFRIQPLVNLTAYTFEVHAMRGLEEGPTSSASATTPDGPAAVPKEPHSMRARQRDQGFTTSWGAPADEDQRAPVTSYLVRHRQIGTSSWQNVSVDECCGKTITGLTNRRHYEVQVAALNRLGTGPWSGLVNVTPQAPYSEPPAPTGDPDLSLGTLALHWTTPSNYCTGPRSFYIIWDGPKEGDRRADEWAAHINTTRGAGEVTYAFRESPDAPGYYEMYGTVNFQGPGSASIKVRGRFGQTWGTWSPTGSLHCFN